MKPPKYEVHLGHPVPPATCSQCGAYVSDQDAHTNWHAALARLLNLED